MNTTRKSRQIATRTLVRSGLQLSELGLGCGTIAGLYEPTSLAEGQGVIADALDAGITYFDTAPFYGAGRAERMTGDCIRDRRQACVLSTKAGRLLRSRTATLAPLPDWRRFTLPRQMWVQTFDFDTVADYTYDGIMRSFEDSQQRLGLSHIDLLLMHDVALPFFFGEHRGAIMKEAMTSGYRALEELRRAGDIGGFGLGVGETQVCVEAFEHGDWDVFLIAGRYTLLEHTPLETLFPLCAARGARVIAGQPFNSGILVGRTSYDHGAPPAQIVERARRLGEVCASHKVDLGAAAIQFPLGHPLVASVLPGPRTRREVAAMVDYYTQRIPAGLWSDLLTEGLLPPGTPTPASQPPDPARRRRFVPHELEFLRRAYARMVTIRRFEEEALRLTKGDAALINGSIHPCMGQEAIPVGALAALRDDDRVLATYRGHGWALESGIEPFELMAEICHRQTGINGGRAGSLMVTAPHRRFIGENSIVGAGGPIACGVALAARLTGSGRVTIVSFGDGAMSQGALHEAFVIAAQDKLPVIFVCENNGWAEMTPGTRAELARRADVYGMIGVTIDGCDPESVRQSVAAAATRARAGDGPTLIECKTVRLGGHYSRDIQHYRSKDDQQSAFANEPIARLRRLLLEQGVAEDVLRAIEADIEAGLADAVERTLQAPLPDPRTIPDHLFAQERIAPRESGGGAVESMTFGQAVNRALQEELAARPEVFVLGEDVGKPGGIFGLTRGLYAQFGGERMRDTPIAESAILGCAVGAAIEGLRPVAEIMFADFLMVALDQLVNQAANVRYLSNGKASAPLVVRTQQGVTPGSCAQHSQCLEALLAHIPGLRIGMPITPQDGYSMLRAAIADPDPCVLFESRSAYLRRGDVRLGGEAEVARGAQRLRGGSDVGIITWGTTVYAALEAAEQLALESVQVAVLNLRWLAPLDEAAIESIVRECSRILVLHEANRTGGFGAEIAARISEHHDAHLQAPVCRLGAADVRMAASPVLQHQVTPNTQSIIAAIRGLLGLTRVSASRRIGQSAGGGT